MAVTTHTSSSDSITIRGIKYTVGDTFVCYASYGGATTSEGGSSAADLTKGETYYFKGYATDDDNGGALTSYPYLVYVTSSTVRGWFKENVFPYATYTINYNANGGSGAPSSQTKTYGTNLTLSSTKPTRTGYTFKGWSLTQGGSVYYQAGGTCGKNENLTLYAVWEEHVLTVNYYSNGATSAFADSLASVGSGKNVKVWTYDFYYDNDYSTYGLANYSGSSGSVYMTRTGYTATGKWGTSTSGGTLVDEDTTFATGQAVAKAFGKDLSSDSASVDVYAQWDENYLEVNYCNNYADYCTYKGSPVKVSSSKFDVVVLTIKFYYESESYSNGLADIQNSDYLYMSRKGYTPTGNWIVDLGKVSINEKDSFATGQELAKTMGKDLSSGSVSVNVYPEWEENTLTANYYSNYATSAYAGTVNEVGDDKNVIVRTHSWTYSSDALSAGLHNYSTEGDTTYLARTRYNPTGYWGTELDGGTLVHEDTGFGSGQELAEAFGLSLEKDSQTIDIYAQWELAASQVIVYLPDEKGNVVRYIGTCYFYDDNGHLSCAILHYYDENGNARVVV